MISAMPLRLTLVGRSYCSLCDNMRTALLDFAIANDIRLKLAQIDLDDFPEWEDKFGIRVPILMLDDFPTGHEICHYHFDEAAFVLNCMSYNLLHSPT
jgi:Glutaredoxin-like domain (DUF836)